MRSCSVLKNKLQCSPCRPTKAYITAKEFAIYRCSTVFGRFIPILGIMVNANLQHFLEINSKTPDESLNHVTENVIDTSQKTSQKAIFDLPTASLTSPYRLLSETFLQDCAFRLILSKFRLRHISDKRCIG